MIKVLCVADVVEPAFYSLQENPEFGDLALILACGDLPPGYLSFLTHVTGVPLYYVNGNHDIRNAATPPAGCVDLHGRLLNFKGLNILGLEGSMWYNDGPYQYTERQMRRVIRRLRSTIWWQGGLDVVVTHAPPRGIHDERDLCHRGFVSFRWLIDKYRPGYFIHGHIHKKFQTPEERISVVGATRVINSYGYHLLEIESQGHSQ